MATWILTASPENHAATAERGFSLIGLKERNRNRAYEIEPGDVIVLYLTKVMRFAGAIRVVGELYEDRAKVWPGKPGKPDPYPWRFETEAVVVVEEPDWVPAEELATSLEHVRKWPAEHWKLAFQGQIRPVSDADRDVLLDRLGAAAGAASA
jgi:EVE domain